MSLPKLSPKQRDILDGVVARVRGGLPLYAACRNSGLRYETARRGLGLPLGTATVTNEQLERAVAAWPSVAGGKAVVS